MSDKLFTYPIDKLLKWILAEDEKGKIFGYYKELFFQPQSTDLFKTKRYGQTLATPLGVAAGPHTQLSQNIILSWLFGARYIELKTVQVLDDIEVAKPCIDMYDEGYNCEWSQELSIEESFNQYLEAWIILHILKEKSGYDFESIFNVSVGYDLKGIQSEKVKWFLKKIRNAEEEIEKKKYILKNIYPAIDDVEIPPEISNNVTLSTMHGCPPDEIESIAKHLIEDWQFHTAVKLNPTLLGKEKLRDILNNKLSYEIEIPDEAFEHDLKFKEAQKIINNLRECAEQNKVEFGLKMTNTLESLNSSSLPNSEKMVYMSGRSLHPISVNTAALLQNEFKGELDISFSGGADAFNFPELIACNLKPVTVCSDLLKPGGYSRLPQYLKTLNEYLNENKAGSIEELILSIGESNDIKTASLKNLNNYASSTLSKSRYTKSFVKFSNIKTHRKLTELDCIQPPCIETCAISQDIPNYLYYTANGNFNKAFQTIIEDNPLPNITGMVCDHLCQSKCTRTNIDNSILIREIKRFVSDKEKESLSKKEYSSNDKRVAVIGAGPSGLSAAYFLALKGIHVDVFESFNSAGGMAKYAIPKFRIDEKGLLRDIESIKSLGVNFHFGQKIDKNKFNELRNNYDYIYVAIGAQKGKKLGVAGEELENVIDQLTFLKNVKEDLKINLGKQVAVIGGGNSAMDAARTAKRLVTGANGEVTVVYRRTQKEMPADKEEIRELLEEKIEVLELTAPKEIRKNETKLGLLCIKMKLGEPDSSGRRRPVEIPNSDFELSFDTIITAIGQEVILDFLPVKSLEVNEGTKETQIENVYAGGDAVRGADSLINAIADGKTTALTILNKIEKYRADLNETSSKISLQEYQQKLSNRVYGDELKSLHVDERNNFEIVNPVMDEEFAVKEASRCLYCDEVCNICVSVCPNLANYYFETEPVKIKYPLIEIIDDEIQIKGSNEFVINQKYQIINLYDFCNECGNCDTFCPTSGAPYKIKPKFALSEDSYNEMDSGYYLFENNLLYKENENKAKLSVNQNKIFYSDNDFESIFDINFNPIEISKKYKHDKRFNTAKIVEMYYYLTNLEETFINR